METDVDRAAHAESHLIQIELRLDGASPIGRASVVGGGTRAFSGWVGLVSAVDALVAGEDGDPTRPGS
jgi:hypothetical protein